MDTGGKLTIETANIRIDQAYIDARNEELAPGRYVMLAVSDDGEGIPAETIDSIFEPFFTTKGPGLGSGLGLSMTVGFMRQSGGTIQVYTEVGRGTTFKLYFPAANVPVDHQSEPTSKVGQTANRGKKLLVAEDEDTLRDTLVKILERAGYQVTATASGDAAYAIFEADPTYDLVVTDIVMPGVLQGTGLAKALRERRSTLPVIFMSGYASEATVHGNGLRPEDIRMMKPVQRADLLAALEKEFSRL
jgi:CheY-like chemotaxis protein